jgi:polysaccharide export outer membrane protein
MTRNTKKLPTILASLALALQFGCASDLNTLPSSGAENAKKLGGTERSSYRIGPGDILEVFVWRNPEISATVPVRPDGKISTPLVEDMVAIGKSPTELARDIEEVLAVYIKSPSVNVIVNKFEGVPEEQVRVVGQAANPQSIPYRESMTVLDIMIAVGGLGEFAAGNRAKLVRKRDGENLEYRIRLDDLLNKGDITQNVDVEPGDIIIIPEALF